MNAASVPKHSIPHSDRCTALPVIWHEAEGIPDAPIRGDERASLGRTA